MRKGIKIVLFIGLGIFVTGVIICAITFAVHGFRWRELVRPQGTAVAEHLENITKTVDEDFDSLEVDVASAELFIRKSSDGSCRIEYMDDPNNEQYEISVKEGKLIFKNTKTDWDWDSPKEILDHVLDHVGNGFVDEDQAATIFLPEKAYRTLEIATASGDILIDEALSFTTTAVTTASGEVEIKNLQSLNILSIATASGNVKLSDMEIGENVSIATASGEVLLEQVSVGGKADITTASGEVTLKKTMFREGEIDTSSGDVKLDGPEADIMSVETASGDVTGKISSEYHVRAHSASGDVQVPAGGKGEWEIETASGDVILEF